MDFSFLSDIKVGRAVVVFFIFSLIILGYPVIYFYDNDLFMKLEFAKLTTLSFAIISPLILNHLIFFFGIVILSHLVAKPQNKIESLNAVGLYTFVLSFFLIIIIILLKIFFDISIKPIFYGVLVFELTLIILTSLIVYLLRKKIIAWHNQPIKPLSYEQMINSNYVYLEAVISILIKNSITNKIELDEEVKKYLDGNKDEENNKKRNNDK